MVSSFVFKKVDANGFVLPLYFHFKCEILHVFWI